MRIFNLNNEYSIVCNYQNTRYGFRHLATLHKNGYEIAKDKICYYNRTWESFEYESILKRIIKTNFTDKQQQDFLDTIQTFH
jgi:hypothetical protein